MLHLIALAGLLVSLVFAKAASQPPKKVIARVQLQAASSLPMSWITLLWSMERRLACRDDANLEGDSSSGVDVAQGRHRDKAIR